MNEHPNRIDSTSTTDTNRIVDHQFGLGQHSDRSLLAKRSCGDSSFERDEGYGDNFWSDCDELAETGLANISDSEEIFEHPDPRGSESGDPNGQIFAGEEISQQNISRSIDGLHVETESGDEVQAGGRVGNDSSSTTDGRVRGTRNGWHACQFFLTYPRTPHREGRTAVLSLLARLGTQRYLVGFENHTDGSEHIHVYLRFQAQRHIKNEDFFDIECGCKHPNIQTVRSYARVASYIAKGGVFEHVGFTPDEVRTFTAKRRSQNRVSLAKTVGQRLLGGERIETIAKEWPELICKDMFRMQANADQMRSFKPELNDRVLKKISIFNLEYQFDPAKSCRGLNGNLHPWIFGDPGCGKSTIFSNLAEEWRIYFVSDGRNWYSKLKIDIFFRTRSFSSGL